MVADNKWSKWKDRLKNHFRLVIMNDDTLREVGSFRIHLLGLYTIISSIAVLLFFLFWLLTAYTPLKKFMPGYNDVYKHPEFIKLNKRITDVEAAFEQQMLYTDHFRRILTGEDSTILQKGELLQETPPQLELVNPEISSTEENMVMDEEVPKDAAQDDFIQIKATESAGISKNLYQLYLIPPLKGQISNHFNPVERHYGIDLLAPKDTPIKAVLSGFVISSDWTLETGNTVCIQHENNLVSFYKHNAINLKKVGTYVKAGEAVAIIGNTGVLSTGPHLHFELWQNGTPVNPTDYISF